MVLPLVWFAADIRNLITFVVIRKFCNLVFPWFITMMGA